MLSSLSQTNFLKEAKTHAYELYRSPTWDLVLPSGNNICCKGFKSTHPSLNWLMHSTQLPLNDEMTKPGKEGGTWNDETTSAYALHSTSVLARLWSTIKLFQPAMVAVKHYLNPQPQSWQGYALPLSCFSYHLIYRAILVSLDQMTSVFLPDHSLVYWPPITVLCLDLRSAQLRAQEGRRHSNPKILF